MMILFLPVAVPAMTAAVPAKVELVISPPEIARRKFDRTHPSPEMPPLKSTEAALCVYQFGCQAECEVESTRILFKTKPAHVTRLKMTLNLKITLWLPDNSTPKLDAHEEAHREVCEVIYRKAPAIAERWGGKVLGLSLQHSLNDDAAVRTELKKLQSDLIAAYMQETATSCARAQQYLDAITSHGTNALPESEAIERALGQETAAAAGPFRQR